MLPVSPMVTPSGAGFVDMRVKATESLRRLGWPSGSGHSRRIVIRVFSSARRPRVFPAMFV